MLTKDQIRKLIELEKLDEKAVSWDKSLLGRTTSGAVGLFSMLKGKIKGSLNQAKMKSLVKNWGIEYLRALKSVEQGLPAPDLSDDHNPLDIDTDDTSALTLPSQNKSIDKSVLNQEIDKISKSKKILESIKKAIESCKAWAIVDNTVGYNAILTGLKPVLKDIQPDDLIVFSEFLIDKADQDQADVDIEYILKLINLFNKSGSTVQDFRSVLDPKIKTKPEFKQKIDDTIILFQKIIGFHDDAIVFIQNFLMLLDSLNELEKDNSKTDEITKRDQNLIKYFTNQNVKHMGQYGEQIKDYMDKVGGKLNESLIIEAKGQNLDKWIISIVDGIDLEQFEKIPDIKNKTLEKMDFKMLDIIKYQANFILDKLQNNKDAEKSSYQDVKKVWELGIKQLNQLFQDVIDTDKVMQNVKADVPNAEIVSQLQSADKATDKLKSFYCDIALPPTGGQFKSKDLYLFNINILTYKGTKITDKYIALSPLAELIEETNGVTYYWHKVFGQYDIINGQIQRQNLFDGISGSISLVNNFNDQDNSYFIAFERQAVSKSYTKTYVYSNKASIFWKNKVYKTMTKEAQTVITSNKDQALKFGGIFQIKINARYLIDSQKITEYPGVEPVDLKSEKFVDQAKINHEEQIKLLK